MVDTTKGWFEDIEQHKVSEVTSMSYLTDNHEELREKILIEERKDTAEKL